MTTTRVPARVDGLWLRQNPDMVAIDGRPAQAAGRDECACYASAVGGHPQEIERGVVPDCGGNKEPDLLHGTAIYCIGGNCSAI